MSDQELSLREHLEELRRRLMISLLALLVGCGVSFASWRQIMELLVRPAQDLNSSADSQLVFIEVTEMLTTSFKVSLWAGFILVLPVILYQAVNFVAPALTRKEKRYLFTFLPGAMLGFLAGVAFAYFVLTPPALHFLITFGSDVATPTIRISNLVDLMLRLLFWMGLAFETPLVMYLLAQLGIVRARSFSRFRRFWVITAFILAAIITPTFDPLNQALVAIPLIALYEIGILLAWVAGLGRRPAETISPVPRRE